jgi:hypothetical protein
MNKYLRHLRKTVSSNEKKLECDILKLTTATLNASCNKQVWACGGPLYRVLGRGCGGTSGCLTHHIPDISLREKHITHKSFKNSV